MDMDNMDNDMDDDMDNGANDGCSGGEEVLLDVGGQDATEAFEDVGHSDEARELLNGMLVGNLKRMVRLLPFPLHTYHRKIPSKMEKEKKTRLTSCFSSPATQPPTPPAPPPPPAPPAPTPPPAWASVCTRFW